MSGLKQDFIVIGLILSIIPISMIITNSIDPLPSWTEGKTKESIKTFINNLDIPKEERIAVFDLDGTLWVEKPLWLDVQFRLLDIDGFNTQDAIEEKRIPWHHIMTAYDGLTQEEYTENAKLFINNYEQKDLVYKPMLELIQYLKDNNFKVYIVTGASTGFVRSVSEEIFDIERERVIGTHPDYTLKNGQIVRLNTAGKPNLDELKVINIQKQIGRMPVFACGNTNNDLPMLKVADFACVIKHDDKEREYYYKDSLFLNSAWAHNWTQVSMKNDFNTIFE